MRMTILAHRSLPRLALSALAAAVLAAPLAGQRTERFTLEGRRVVISNLAGEVRMVPGTGSSVVVEVTRGGRDAAQLRVVRDGGELRVVYPGNRVVYGRMDARARPVDVAVRRNGAIGSGFGVHQVTVAGTGAGTQAWADVRVLVPAGRHVLLYQGVGGVQAASVNGGVQVRTEAAPVRTRGTRGELDLEARRGGVEVIDAEGEVTVASRSGHVVVENVRGPLLEVTTGHGSVTGRGLRAEVLDVGTGNGAVNLSGVRAREAEVRTGSGGVTLEMASDADLEIDTGSGGVTVGLPASFGARMEIATGSGAITVDVPVANRRTARNSLEGRVGDGAGTLLIETGSGAVRVRRN